MFNLAAEEEEPHPAVGVHLPGVENVRNQEGQSSIIIQPVDVNGSTSLQLLCPEGKIKQNFLICW